MLGKLTIPVLLIAILFFPSLCPAQAKEIPPGRWWRVPYFYEPLHITEEQKTDLDKLFEESRNKLLDLRKRMEDEKRDLVSMIEQKDLNEGATTMQMKRLESTRTRLAATRFGYSLEVRKLLGHDRFQQLKNLYRGWDGSSQNSARGE